MPLVALAHCLKTLDDSDFSKYGTFYDVPRACWPTTSYEKHVIYPREATAFQTSKQLRGIFDILVLDGGSTLGLWNEFEDNLPEPLPILVCGLQTFGTECNLS